MATRSWRWLRLRILGLLCSPVGHDLAGNPVWTTRLQAAVTPAAPDERKAAKS